MTNLFEEGFNLGLGVVGATANTVEKLVQDTLNRTGIAVNDKDDESLHSRLVNEGKATREKIRERMADVCENFSELSPCARRLDKIVTLLEEIKAELAASKAKENSNG